MVYYLHSGFPPLHVSAYLCIGREKTISRGQALL